MRDAKLPFINNTIDEYYGARLNGQQRAFARFLYATDGVEKYNALQTAIFYTWPEFIDKAEWDGQRIVWTPSSHWNPWLERNLKFFCNTKFATKRGDTIFRNVALTGCGGAGKTFAAGLYTCLWWMIAPHESIATFTSTTVDMIRQRIWPVVSHYWETAANAATGELYHPSGIIGDKVDSQLVIRNRKGDDKHAIKALAVAHGETQKALHNLKGRHAKRMLLVVDEANGTPEAIFEVVPNMRKGCQDMTVIIIGNPASRLDPHGRALTPEIGWNAITEDINSWRTKAVPEWQLDPGVALRFDGKQSPNVILQKTIYPYIYTWEDWQNAHNTPNYIGTPNYYFMDRGLHLPEGMSCTVFTEQLFARCADGTQGQPTWDGETQLVAFLDPAFTAGGDEAFYRVGKMGQWRGKWHLQLLEGYAFPISPELESYDVDYQLARRFISEGKTRRIEPACAGLDCTGGGRGVGAIIAAEWSNRISYQTWGGAASEHAVAAHDGVPARDIYANRVTELWWNVRTALENGQISGFSRTEMVQGCARLYEHKGKRIQVEPKADMKSRVRYSPDQMDAVAGLLAVAMSNGFILEGRIAAEPTPRHVLDDVLGIGPQADPEPHAGEIAWGEQDVNDNVVTMTGSPEW